MTVCEHCKKPLAELEEVHAYRGSLYCSKECTIKDIMNDYIMNAKELAIEDYVCCAEIVATSDILADEIDTEDV